MKDKRKFKRISCYRTSKRAIIIYIKKEHELNLPTYFTADIEMSEITPREKRKPKDRRKKND